MSNFRFEGDLNGLNERQLEFIGSVLEDRGFKNEIVAISVLGKADDNYVTNVKRIVVEKDGQEFVMIAKVAPTCPITRSKMPTKELFRNEHIMYTSTLPKLTELEKSASIPENERFKYAKCYGSLSEEPNEIILLEDLNLHNFAMLDKTKFLTNETVKLVVKTFAKFHSLSYVLKNKEPEMFDSQRNEFVHVWALIAEIKEFKTLFDYLEVDIMAMLDNNKHKNVMRGLLSQFTTIINENCEIDKDSRYGIIQHGDAWTNNFLFTSEGDRTVDCCLIDYQVSTHTSPAADLEFMIFMCTDYETRSKHYHEWIDYYYAELVKNLTNFGLKSNIIYPRDQLDIELKRVSKLVLAIAIVISSFNVRETDEATLYKEAMKSDSDENVEERLAAVSFSKVSKETANRFKNKLVGFLTSLFELGYI